MVGEYVALRMTFLHIANHITIINANVLFVKDCLGVHVGSVNLMLHLLEVDGMILKHCGN
jgi:hypothetical protein